MGFEYVERTLEKIAKGAAESYPPYNIEQLDRGRIRISLAVAGFEKEDLNITIEDNELVIRGIQNDNADKTYLHRGIAARQFRRCFILERGIEIAGAFLADGLLNIDLIEPKDTNQTRTIAIGDCAPLATMNEDEEDTNGFSAASS